jgi:hypothetical protein
MMNELIEFKVTQDLVNKLGEFIARECQFPQAAANVFASPELLSMHLRDCQVKTAQRVRRLLALLQSQGVPSLDSDVCAAVEDFRQLALKGGSGGPR